MFRQVTIAFGAVIASTALAACAATDLPAEGATAQAAGPAGLQETAYDCAAGVYDRMFQTPGSRIYNAEERNRITGMLRDNAVAGQGADDESERRIRNMLSDGYGDRFLDAYRSCMTILT